MRVVGWVKMVWGNPKRWGVIESGKEGSKFGK